MNDDELFGLAMRARGLRGYTSAELTALILASPPHEVARLNRDYCVLCLVPWALCADHCRNCRQPVDDCLCGWDDEDF